MTEAWPYIGARDVCWYCGGRLVWDSDFEYNEIYDDADGIATMLHYTSCGAIVLYALRDEGGAVAMSNQQVIIGNNIDVLRGMPSESIDCVVTSPPYWALRDYGSEPVIYGGADGCAHEWSGQYCTKCGAWKGQLGLEPTPQEYIDHLLILFDEVKRVLKPTGACWVNLGDTYNGNKKGNTDTGKNRKAVNDEFYKQSVQGIGPKSLVMVPARFAIAMCEHGWILRNKIIWHKPNVMPQSCSDRFTVDYEEFFYFTKEPTYYFVQQKEPIKELSLKRSAYGFHSKKFNQDASGKRGVDVNKMGSRFVNPEGRNKRTVWSIPTSGSSEDHCAMFPPALIETPIKACTPEGGVVLDPFCGSGTVLEYCFDHDIEAVGIEINPAYKDIIRRRARSGQKRLGDYTEEADA